MSRKINVVAAVIRQDGKILLCSRPPEKPPVGWEFPGGKIEPGETPEAALRRELREELALQAEIGSQLDAIRVVKPEVTIDIAFYLCRISKGSVVAPCEGQEFGWFSPENGVPPELLAADLPVWRKLTQEQ